MLASTLRPAPLHGSASTAGPPGIEEFPRIGRPWTGDEAGGRQRGRIRVTWGAALGEGDRGGVGAGEEEVACSVCGEEEGGGGGG